MLKAGGSIDMIHVDLKLNNLKTLHAEWMVDAIQIFKANSIKLGWHQYYLGRITVYVPE